jgi:hypothetical protein
MNRLPGFSGDATARLTMMKEGATARRGMPCIQPARIGRVAVEQEEGRSAGTDDRLLGSELPPAILRTVNADIPNKASKLLDEAPRIVRAPKVNT